MKSSNQDKVKSTFHASKSRDMESVRKNPELEAKGKGEKVAAKRSKKSAS